MNKIEELANGQWVVAGDTHLGTWAKEHGSIITDPYLFKFLKPQLEGVKVVWDIGANIGDHTRQYLDWGMPVVAVEPNPVAFECLQHNCPEAMCLNVAASDFPGELKFAQLENVGASRISDTGDIMVEADALDSMNLPVPDFVKIDVEGWEVNALIGMLSTLRDSKPIVYIEINRDALHQNNCDPLDIMRLLMFSGYKKFVNYPLGVEWEAPQFDILATP